MGLYDTFCSSPSPTEQPINVQLKVGPCLCKAYFEGQEVSSKEFPDAIYHAPEGIVVIWQNHVLAVCEVLPKDLPNGLVHKTKWGDDFNPSQDTLEDFNPFIIAMRQANAEAAAEIHGGDEPLGYEDDT